MPKETGSDVLSFEGFTISYILYTKLHITINLILISCSPTILRWSLHEITENTTRAKPLLESPSDRVQWLCIFFQCAVKLLGVGRTVNSLASEVTFSSNAQERVPRGAVALAGRTMEVAALVSHRGWIRGQCPLWADSAPLPRDHWVKSIMVKAHSLIRRQLWCLIRTTLQQNIIYCNTLLCLMQWESKQGWRELKSIAFSSQQRYQFVGNYLFVVFIVNPNNSKVVNAVREKMKLHIQFILRRNKLPRRKEGIYLHSCGGVGDILCDGAASPSGPQGDLAGAAGVGSKSLVPFLWGGEAVWESLQAQCWSVAQCGKTRLRWAHGIISKETQLGLCPEPCKPTLHYTSAMTAELLPVFLWE